MALGQAFVEVHADLSTFRRDLSRELKKITDDFEKQLNAALGSKLTATAGNAGRQAGQSFSDDFEKQTRRKMGDKQSSVWVSITSALASALDDGISALPAQAKAALVAAIIAVAPLLAGALSGALAAGLGLVFVGLGAALATQFEAVQTGWQRFLSSTRNLLVGTAGAFQGALLRSFDTIEVRLKEMAPGLTSIFDTAATFLEPFINSLLDALDVFLIQVEGVFGETGSFVEELGRGLVVLADTIGFAFTLLVNTGEDGRKALRDLIGIVAILIISFTQMLVVFTKIYGFMRDFSQFITSLPAVLQVLVPHLAIMGHLTAAIDEASGANEVYFSTNLNVVDSQGRVITKTKEEEDALKKLQEALRDTADAALDVIDSNVNYEESVDELQETLRRTRKNINIDTEAGRESVRAFSSAIKDLREQMLQRVLMGQLTTEQAVAQYNKEISRIEELGNKAGVTDQKFRELFGVAIEFGRLELSPSTAGIDSTTASVQSLVGQMQRAINVARNLSVIVSLIPGTGLIAASLRAAGFSDGGVIDRPTLMVAGEGNKEEVVIPLTKPARAAELMRQTGLDQMGGDTQVLVFIGDEQLDSRMVRVAKRVSSGNGLALSQGYRGF